MKLPIFPALVIAVAFAACGVECSVPRLSAGRIVGGKTTTITDHPYQVSLVYNGFHRCGGAIISEYFVLSAAHCFYSLSSSALSNLQIRAGSSYRASGGTLHEISYYIYHSSFSSSTYDYDIALVKVKLPFEFGSTVQPIEIPSSDYTLRDGTIVGVSGWGATSWEGSSASILQVVEVPLMNNTYCGELYAKLNQITSRMLCAGYTDGGKDACQGDSGGPLFYDNTLIGLVSWGNECAAALQPGVYASVSNLRDWIVEKTGLDFS